MPMNPRMLRPLATRGLDADARTYIAAVEAADGETLEQGVKTAINDFVTGCKSDGIWESIKASCILAGARTLAGSLVPLKGAAPLNNNFTSANYDRETGLVGDGSQTYLDTNRANDDDPQDDKHISAYISTVPSSAGTVYIASAGRNIVGSSSFFRGSVTTNWGVNRPSTASTTDVLNADMIGFAGMSRFQAADFEYRANGATNTSSAFPSATPDPGDLFVMSDGSSYHSDARIAFYSIGESLDLEALDARVSALITAIGAAI